MSLITLILLLATIGFILWAINSFIPMDVTVKRILNVIVVVAVILFLLKSFGVLGHLSGVKI